MHIPIIEQSKDYIVADKPSGLLSQKGKNASDKDLLSILQKKTKAKLHLLNRIDRPVSGLLLLSFNSKFNQHFVKLQSEGKVDKYYIGIVEGQIESDELTYTDYLYHHRKLRKAFISKEEKKDYKVVELKATKILSLDRYTVLKIHINQGKFHQIRSQLAFHGFPIKGDVKYGARRGNKDKSISLHSFELKFQTRAGEFKQFTAELPKNDNLWNIVSEKLNASNE